MLRLKQRSWLAPLQVVRFPLAQTVQTKKEKQGGRGEVEFYSIRKRFHDGNRDCAYCIEVTSVLTISLVHRVLKWLR